MNIKKSTVTKMFITGVEDLDPINVFIGDMNANRGRITIACFDNSWSYYWGSIGERTMTQFFCACSDDYLARKFHLGIESTVIDSDAIARHAKAHICKIRKDRDIEKDKARELFEEIDSTDFDGPDSEYDLMYRIYGDEWWYKLPQKANPEYEYLCRVVQVVREALLMEVAKV